MNSSASFPLLDICKGSSVLEGTAADQGSASVLQMQHLRSTVMLSPSPPTWDLQLRQQQACPTVPREQFLQLQQQLLQAERINQCLQEELENRTSETNTPQVRGSVFPHSKLRSPNLTCLLGSSTRSEVEIKNLRVC